MNRMLFLGRGAEAAAVIWDSGSPDWPRLQARQRSAVSISEKRRPTTLFNEFDPVVLSRRYQQSPVGTPSVGSRFGRWLGKAEPYHGHGFRLRLVLKFGIGRKSFVAGDHDQALLFEIDLSCAKRIIIRRCGVSFSGPIFRNSFSKFVHRGLLGDHLVMGRGVNLIEVDPTLELLFLGTGGNAKARPEGEPNENTFHLERAKSADTIQ